MMKLLLVIALLCAVQALRSFIRLPFHHVLHMCETESEEITSRDITKMEKKIEELQATIQSVIEQRQQVGEEYDKLDAEYGSEIDRVKKEFSRMKERAVEEAVDATNAARASALKEILPISDNYARAKSLYDPLSNEKEQKIIEIYDGIFTSFQKVIEDFGLQRVESIGKPFDYKFMEAIMTAPSTEYGPDIVTMEYQVGWKMEEKSIRPAMVVVSTGPGPQ